VARSAAIWATTFNYDDACGSPLLWVDEDTLLAGEKNVVFRYNLKTRSQESVYEIRGDQATIWFNLSCFSSHRWALYVERVVNNAHLRHWVLVDWKDIRNPTETETEIGLARINPADCLTDTDVLPAEPIRVAFDKQRNRFFGYTTPRGFNGPVQAGWLGRLGEKLVVQSTVKLPAGPWVQGHSFFKSLSCFSCGCDCYSFFNVYVGNDRVFAMVWGRGVADGQSGIYELVKSSQEVNWKKLVAEQSETTANMVFSPDGCKVAYSFGMAVTLLEVCSR